MHHACAPHLRLCWPLDFLQVHPVVQILSLTVPKTWWLQNLKSWLQYSICQQTCDISMAMSNLKIECFTNVKWGDVRTFMIEAIIRVSEHLFWPVLTTDWHHIYIFASDDSGWEAKTLNGILLQYSRLLEVKYVYCRILTTLCNFT